MWLSNATINAGYDTVAAGGDPAASWLENVHMLADIPLYIGRSPFNQRPGKVNVSKKSQATAVALFVVPEVNSG